jgi:hypothetical protein
MASSERANWDADDDDEQSPSLSPHAPTEQHVELSHEHDGEVPLRPPKPEVFSSSFLKELLDSTKPATIEQPTPRPSVETVAPTQTVEQLSSEGKEDDDDDDEEEDEDGIVDTAVADASSHVDSELGEPQELPAHEIDHGGEDELPPTETMPNHHTAETTPDAPKPFVYEEEDTATEDTPPPSNVGNGGGTIPSQAAPLPKAEVWDWDSNPGNDVDIEPDDPLPQLGTYGAPLAPSVAETTPSAPVYNAEQDVKAAINDAEYRGEKRGLSRGVAASFIMMVVVGAYLNRKHNRAEAVITKKLDNTSERLDQTVFNYNELNKKTTAQASRLEQVAYNRPAVGRFEQPLPGVPNRPRFEQQNISNPTTVETTPPQAVEADSESVDQMEDGRIVLQPGQRLERRGQYSVVIGADGREVQGAVKYGAEYQRDHRQELTPTSLNSTGGNNGSAVDGDTYVGAVGLDGILGSGQADYSHELPPGHPSRIDTNHRLAEPKHPIAAAASSPWLWAALAVLLLAFFAAAFA